MVVSGRPITPTVADILVKKGYPSRWWVSQRVVERLGLVKENPEDAPYITPNGVEIFNISQMKECEKLERYAGKVLPKWLIGDYDTSPSIAQALFRYLTNERNNTWIKEEEVVALGARPRPDCNVLTMTLTNEKTLTLYNVDDMVNADKVRADARMYPVSVNSASKFHSSIAGFLLEISKNKGYTSPYWLSAAMAQYLGCPAREGEKATIVPTENSHFSVFNADQTIDRTRVAAAAVRRRVQPIDLSTGKFFAEPLASIFQRISMEESKPCSTFWCKLFDFRTLEARVNTNDTRCHSYLFNGKAYKYFNLYAAERPNIVFQAAKSRWKADKIYS